jgi:hypothetical protein
MIKKYSGLYVKYPLVLADLMKLVFSGQIFEKYSDMKFYESLSSWSRVIPRGQTEGRTEMMKLIVAFAIL